MQRNGWGRIINVGSIMGTLGRENLHAYVASKHAVTGLTKSMAAELGANGVTVNCIAPGYFKTDLTQPLQLNSTFANEVCSQTPARRWGAARELAGPAVFLASESASYVNGATLVVDGGMSSTFHFSE
mmetsp:Transcript_39703/g.69823  ORF Transcript_39703/g.69823 Transcript_39703/m.69823 type:complete len:128 (+) Transcript_39703:2-385(+)